MGLLTDILDRMATPELEMQLHPAILWCGAGEVGGASGPGSGGARARRPQLCQLSLSLTYAEVRHLVRRYRSAVRAALRTAHKRGLSSGASPGLHEQPRVAILLDGDAAASAMVLHPLELAVVCEGAVAVPLNPTDPRVAQMLATVRPAVAVVSSRDEAHTRCLADHGACVILTESDLIEAKPATDDRPIDPRQPRRETPSTTAGPATELSGVESRQRGERSADVAIFFTSGSTGTPKACTMGLAALDSYARGKNAVFGVDQSAVVLVASPPTFDPSLGDAFATWLAGGTLAVSRAADIYADLGGCLSRAKATHVLTTPSLLGSCDPAHRPPSLRAIGVGGEPPPRKLVDAWTAVVPLVLNVYGVTEACCYQAYIRLQSGGEAAAGHRSLGMPLHAGCALLGLAADPQAVPRPIDSFPVGELFEVVLVGNAVSLGYLGGTSAGHYWDAEAGQPGFHTGDFAVRSGNGCALLKGRRDGMVKINGVRIECGEVECAIMAVLPTVIANVCVVAYHRRLWAFACCAGEASAAATQARIRRALRLLVRQVLPRQMVPASIVFLDALPVSPNGKVDRKELVAHARDAVAEGPASAQPAPDEGADTEVLSGWLALVVTYLADELDLSPACLGPGSDFRALSGDSLVALRVCKRLAARVQRDGGASAGALELGLFGEGLLPSLSPVFLLETHPVLEHYAEYLLGRVGTPSTDPAGSSPSVVVVNAAHHDAAPGPASRGQVPEVAALVGEAAAASEEALVAALVPAMCEAIRSSPQREQLEASAVHSAVGAAAAGCVRVLLKAGMSPNAKFVEGVRPLHAAARSGSLQGMIEVLEVLLEAGGKVRALDDNRQSVMHHAARGGAGRRCIDLLLDAWTAATPKAKGPTQSTCLTADKWGRTPLHWAVQNGHRTAVVALLEMSSDPAAKDSAGESPLQVAERRAQCRAVDRPHGFRPADFGGIATLLGGNSKTVRLKDTH